MDLDSFDDYNLASHIAQVPLPVITGIGHERDNTICDMVAHTSLKTPTAVAEFIIGGVANYEAGLEETFQSINQISRNRINEEKINLTNLLAELKLRSLSALTKQNHHLNSTLDKVRILGKMAVTNEFNKLESIESKVVLLDPQQILEKGYSFTTINGKSISNKKISKGDQIETYTEDKIISSTVDKIKNYGKD